MSCTPLLSALMGSLTPTEKRIATYLLDHGNDVMHMNAKQLGDACGVSPASVVRLAKKLGFNGFTSLKIDLARESVQPHSEPDAFKSAISEGDDMPSVIAKAEHIHLRNTSLTYQLLNPQVLQSAIDALLEGRRIHLFGIGASGLLALDFLYKGSRVGMPVFYCTDSHTNLATAALLGSEDVVIAISYSGKTPETLLAAQAASDNGATVIAITKASPNPLSRLASYSLYMPSEEGELRVGAMTSRMSGLLLLDLLYLGYVRRCPQNAQQSLDSTRNLIRGLREE